MHKDEGMYVDAYQRLLAPEEVCLASRIIMVRPKVLLMGRWRFVQPGRYLSSGTRSHRPLLTHHLAPGPMPYIRQQFHARIAPLADIVELTSGTMDELEADMKSKYKGLVAIYHFRDPGSYFGFLGEPFFSTLPDSCKTLCHREVAAARRESSPADDAFSGGRVRRHRRPRCEAIRSHCE